MTEEKERELTREELRAQLNAEFNTQDIESPDEATEATSSDEETPVQPEETAELDQPLQTSVEDDPSTDLTNREMKDHLPIKQTWQIVLYGIFYAAFGLMLVALSVSVILSDGNINIFGWVFILFFLLGGLAALYSSIEEFRHLKFARQLDEKAIEFRAKIADSWADNYQDGGVLVRKDVHHLLYFYNDDKNYAKHAITRSLSKSLQGGGWVTIEYLEDKPEIFRVKVNL